MAQQYSVFLSYRHKPFDAAVTKRVFNLLETYRLPVALRLKGHRGITRVFRDTEELPVSRQLTDTIRQALENSDCLVVVCSPDTPTSEWVDREVATFIELGRAERIFPLLIDGRPAESFPPSLRKIPDIMERLMDVRGQTDSISANLPGPLLKVIAAVAGCQTARLARAEQIRHNGKTVWRASFGVALVAAVAVISGIFWVRAENYRAVALREQERCMAVLSHLTYDLPNALVELPNTYAAVAEILDENAEQINRILELARQQDGIYEQIAANYEKHATASSRLGRFETAAESQQKAVAVYEMLVEDGVAGAESGLASTHNNFGVVWNAAGEFEAAAKEYGEAVALLEPLCEGEPALQADLALFYANIGANAMDFGDYPSAIQALTKSLEILAQLEAAGKGTEDDSAARARYNLGVCLMSTGEYADAEAHLTEAVEWYAARYASVQNRSRLKPYAQSLAQKALCLSRMGKLTEAAELFPEAIAMLETLAQGGDDATATSLLSTACNNYGLCLNMSGDYAAAAPWYIRYATLREELYVKSATDLNRAGLARAYYNIAENAFKLGDYAQTREFYDKCIAEYAPVSESLGSYHAAEYLARLSYYHIIITHDYPKALEAADEAADLQPESSFVQLIRIYALLYNGRYEECDAEAAIAAARSEGDRLNIELDFAALTAAGLYEPHMDAVIALMNG